MPHVLAVEAAGVGGDMLALNTIVPALHAIESPTCPWLRFFLLVIILVIFSLMGATHVTVAVSHPADPERRWEGLFLVDTGAIDCMAPAKHLRNIGIEPRGKRTYELADGTEIVMDIGVASIEFMGEVVGVTIIFGQDDIEPILGVTALESVGIEVDPQNQRLKRLPAVRLK